MLVRIPLVIAALLLSGCATVVSNTCPSLFAYSDELQARAADELDALPPGSALAQMISDYGVTRAEIRTCRGEID